MVSKSQRLKDMAAAEALEAPDLLGASDGPEMDGITPYLPQPCPVSPLGILGSQLVFLDGLQQVQLVAADCKKGDMIIWFGIEYLEEYFMNEGKGQDRWDQRKAQIALNMDCRNRGIFNPVGKVLGRGAHRPQAEEETLVLHIGRHVLIARPEHRPGHHTATITMERHAAGMVRMGGKDLFFPAADSLPAPAAAQAERAEGEALLALLHSWRWVDEAAPLLLLGWIGQAFICGALDWRAHIWLQGDTACGKSSLQKVVRAVLHSTGIICTADASAAAIRQMLNSDALPVSVDEAEKHDNPERLQELLNLMKKSSSGDTVLRGSADHKAKEFVARSAYLLSSVLRATLRGEDANRIPVLELHKLPENVEPLEMELARWRNTGPRLQRRMVEQWGRFDRTLAIYRRRIGELGYAGRWQDTYGTLLACADLLLYDYAPDDPVLAEVNPIDEPGISRVRGAVAQTLPMLAKGKVEGRSDTERAIAHLLSKSLPGERGAAAEPVGTWLSRAMDWVPGEFESSPQTANDKARDRLKAYGMRVVQIVQKPDPKNPGHLKPGIVDAGCGEEGWRSGYLALAYQSNTALQDLWRGTEWSGDGYLQSLRKGGTIERPTISPRKIRFNGMSPDNALLVPLDCFRGDED